MPTQSDVQLYALGMRMKQAMILTRSVGYSNAKIVRAIVSQLITAIDSLGASSPLTARELQELKDLKKPCRALMRKILRSEDDDFLEVAYDEFSRQLQLSLNALDLIATTSRPDIGRDWFKLGLEIVDGWNDDSDEGSFRNDDDEESKLPPKKGGKQSKQTEAEQPVPWNWGNKERVDRLLEQLVMREEELFPPNDAELSQSPWLIDLPVSWLSWSRFEAGLLTLWSTATKDPVAPPSDIAVDRPFIPTALQRRILDALDGRALNKPQLAEAVAAGDASRLYKRGGLKELRERNIVSHQDGIGYFRLDALPKQSSRRGVDH